jgi:hypothetical protein
MSSKKAERVVAKSEILFNDNSIPSRLAEIGAQRTAFDVYIGLRFDRVISVLRFKEHHAS